MIPALMKFQEGGELTIRSKENVELKCNTTFVKKYQTRQTNHHNAHQEERATTLTRPVELPELQELSMSDTAEFYEDVAHGDKTNTSSLEGTTISQSPPRIQTPLLTRPQWSTKMPARFQDFVL